MLLKEYLKNLELWLENIVKTTNQKGIIFGISGGVDSALVAALVKKAFPNNHLALIMPCYSSELDTKLAWELTEKLSLNSKLIDLKNIYDTFLLTNDNLSNLAKANVKARLRMTTLYAHAQTNNYLVAGTDNACEWYVGYFTKFGDGAADIAPLIYLNKAEVCTGAKLYNVNDEIITRAPTAGLWDGQSDEEELGFKYEILDKFLEDKNSIDPKIAAKIELLHQKTNHKRIGILKPSNFFKE